MSLRSRPLILDHACGDDALLAAELLLEQELEEPGPVALVLEVVLAFLP